MDQGEPPEEIRDREERGGQEERKSQRKLTFDQAFQGAKTFSEKYVERGPYEFFPEAEVVEVVQRGLAENQISHGYRYCPWMPLSGDPVEDRKKICPCDRHHEDIQRDGFCIWMFFVSEEFLRKYEQGEDFAQTIDEAVKPGEGLFDQDYQSKADFKERGRPAEPAAEAPPETWPSARQTIRATGSVYN